MKLSQDRTRSVLQYCLTLLNNDKELWIRERATANGLSFNFDGEQLIWVHTNAPSAVKIHELLHAVLNICDFRGIDRKDDEVLCYMLEYLVKSL